MGRPRAASTSARAYQPSDAPPSPAHPTAEQDPIPEDATRSLLDLCPSAARGRTPTPGGISTGSYARYRPGSCLYYRNRRVIKRCWYCSCHARRCRQRALRDCASEELRLHLPRSGGRVHHLCTPSEIYSCALRAEKRKILRPDLFEVEHVACLELRTAGQFSVQEQVPVIIRRTSAQDPFENRCTVGRELLGEGIRFQAF